MATALGVYASVPDVKLRLGITDTTDDVLLGQICDEVNDWIESYTGRVLGPVASSVYYFDGSELDDLGAIDLGGLGAQSVSLVEVSYDLSTWTTIAADRYALRPLRRQRSQPATRLVLTDGTTFFTGYNNIRVTMVAGYAEVPDEVRAVAIAIAQRWWHGRQTGMIDVIGSDENSISPGAYQQVATLVKTVPPEFRRTLDRYKEPVLA